MPATWCRRRFCAPRRRRNRFPWGRRVRRPGSCGSSSTSVETQWRRRATKRRFEIRGEMPHAAGFVDAESAMVARSVVWQALGTLPPRRRAVLVMHELEGLGNGCHRANVGRLGGHRSMAPVERTASAGAGNSGTGTTIMSSLQERLKDADPVAHEPPLSNEVVQQMRHAVLTSAGAVRPRRMRTNKAAWAVAGAAGVVALAVGVNQRWLRDT